MLTDGQEERPSVMTWIPRTARYPGLAAVAAVAALASPALAEDDASITFTARNLFDTANGSFHSWRVTEARIDPAAPAVSFVVVEVDLASVDTGNEDRDEHLRTADFFDVKTHPTARVRAHGVEPAGAGEDGLERYRASFDIDLHGVQKTLPGEFTLVSREPFVVEGEVVMNRLDFGVGGPQRFWNPLSITEEIPVSFRAAIPR